MAYFAVADSSLVLAMGKRDIAFRTAIYFNVFSAFILGGHGANDPSTCQHGEDRYKYYQQFKFHIDGPLGNSDLPEGKNIPHSIQSHPAPINLSVVYSGCQKNVPHTVAKLIDN